MSCHSTAVLNPLFASGWRDHARGLGGTHWSHVVASLLRMTEYEGGRTDRTASLDELDLQAALKGEEAAYARLVQRYQAAVSSQMLRFSRQRTVIEELVQEVFVQAYFSLPKFNHRSPWLHWLRKIAMRVGYKHWQRAARERRHYESRGLSAAVQYSTDQPSSPAETSVFELLDRLPPRDRLVLVLMYVDEYSVAEIAEQIGWSRIMVKVQAHRARKKLQRLLEAEDE